MQIPKGKQLGYLVILVVVVLFTFGALQTVVGDSMVTQWVFTVLVVALVTYILYMFFTPSSDLKTWAEQKGLVYTATRMRSIIDSRLAANPSKEFFGMRTLAREVKSPSYNLSIVSALSSMAQTDPSMISGPVVQGAIGGRTIWIYPVMGKVLRDSISSHVFSGWCFEFETHKIPIRVLTTRRFLDDYDTLDTESRSFEKLYDINVRREGTALQLLDPVMMELIEHSDISALEFSDSSVALYHTLLPAKQEKLNSYAHWGMKIAEQVDRNFPLNN